MFARIVWLLFGCMLLLSCADNRELSEGARTAPGKYLPEFVKPVKYVVELTVYRSEQRFTGHVEIDVELSQATDYIWLHAFNLDFGHMRVIEKGIVGASIQQIDRSGNTRIDLDRPIGPGRAKLIMDYRADFTPGPVGMYRVSDRGEDYDLVRLTHNTARLLIPAFDDGRHSAPMDFKVSVEDNSAVFFLTPPSAQYALQNSRRMNEFVPVSKLLPDQIRLLMVDRDNQHMHSMGDLGAKVEELYHIALAQRGQTSL